MSVPAWVKDAIFYQIFPDRFENGDPQNDPPNKAQWGTKPTAYTFFGGDLKGILQRLDHLSGMGINAIYLNPIFQSASTHRYNATDYFQIDRKLGGMDDWQALVKAAHQRDIRIILDGVFNHCGRGFFAFSDILENGNHSPYRDWFHIYHYPVDAYSRGKAKDYLGWWRYKSLPKFNTGNTEVRRYLLDIARYWIEQGADGWRLDVPNEIDDDAFWAEFRHVVRAANPEAYLVGEIWEVAPRWVGDHHFDGLMNYPLRTAVLELLSGRIKASAFADHVENLLTVYPRENVYALLNSLGTHDNVRIITTLGGNTKKVKLAYSFLFAYPGAPCIYYGDEIGLNGHKDPDCRRSFPWDTRHWNQDLYQHIRQLSLLRQEHAVMRHGDLNRVMVDEKQNCYVFVRFTDASQIIVALNVSALTRTLSLPVAEMGWPDGVEKINLLNGDHYPISGGHLSIKLPAYSSAWIR
ncbi:MAG TPA: glycoside hydrolase family 13 protein [Levilinea sp.]|nr:glycoside hydrolase family 13 protein [Levilinea sp.]